MLLLVLADTVDLSAAKLFVRVGKEHFPEDPDSPGLVFVTCFRRERRLWKLPYRNRYAVPIPLDTAYRTTFVELLDSSSDTSCVVLLRHGQYANPYAKNKERETLVRVVEPTSPAPPIPLFPSSAAAAANVVGRARNEDECAAADEKVERFVSNAFDLTNVLDVEVLQNTEWDMPLDPLTEMESLYERDQPVLLENADCDGDDDDDNGIDGRSSMVSGLYWKNAEHWETCYESDLWAAPSHESLLPIQGTANMPLLLRQLHMNYVSRLGKANAKHDDPLPPDLLRAGAMYPQLMSLDSRVMNKLFDSVIEETRRALTGVFENATNPSSVRFRFVDYRDSVLLVTRRGLFGVEGGDVDGNPFSPLRNSYMCGRWGLNKYVDERYPLATGSKRKLDRSRWGKFFVRNGRVVGVVHPTGHTYGQTRYDPEPLRMMRSQMKRIGEIDSGRAAATGGGGGGGLSTSPTSSQLAAVRKTVDEVIGQGLGPAITYVCYYDVGTGRVYLSHPLFTPGRCITLPPHPLTSPEMDLLLGAVRHAGSAIGLYSTSTHRNGSNDNNNKNDNHT